MLEAARAAIRARYRAGWHSIGCAIHTASGRVHVGVHLECSVGRVAVCAEAIAIGAAVTAGDGEIETIVTVRQASETDEQPAVVAPCGMCREMIADYAPEARVIVPSEDGGEAVPIGTLIPHRFSHPGSS